MRSIQNTYLTCLPHLVKLIQAHSTHPTSSNLIQPRLASSNIIQSTSLSQPHLINLINLICLVNLIQSATPGHTSSIRPYPVSLTQSTSFSQPHPANLIHHPQLFLRLIFTQTIWKERRRYRVTEAEEGELFVKQQGGPQTLPRKTASSTIPSPQYKGR